MLLKTNFYLMKTRFSFVATLFLIISSLIEVSSQSLAFPTAEGFGKFASGGRGGKVVFVDNLNDYGSAESEVPGSFRWALKQYPGEPLTVIFRVSGTINLKGEPGSTSNKNDIRCSRANLTIAGQTAPGEGITFRGAKLNFGGSNNLIIRNIRSRIGLKDDGSTIYGAALGIENATNWIIDHCCFGWSVEENMTIYDNKYTTIQNSIIHEGLYEGGHMKGNRSYAAQWGGQSATFYKNLLAHHRTRTPRFNGARGSNDTKVFIEYTNNVNYNWIEQGGCYGSEIAAGIIRYNNTNFINNYYKPGPSTIGKIFTYVMKISTTNWPKFYINGNIYHNDTASLNNQWKYVLHGSFLLDSIKSDKLIYDSRFDYDKYRVVKVSPAEQAYLEVLADVGTIHRDTIERRIIREVTNGVTTFNGILKPGIIDSPWNAEGYPEYILANSPNDLDNDGIADEWEISKGLNPADSEDRNKITLSGYTALEVYLNSLMGENIELKFNTAVDYISIKPKMDMVQIRNIITINSVSEIKELKIFDVDGRKMDMYKKIQRNIIDVACLKNGIYLISAISKDEEKASFKFLRK